MSCQSAKVPGAKVPGATCQVQVPGARCQVQVPGCQVLALADVAQAFRPASLKERRESRLVADWIEVGVSAYPRSGESGQLTRYALE